MAAVCPGKNVILKIRLNTIRNDRFPESPDRAANHPGNRRGRRDPYGRRSTGIRRRPRKFDRRKGEAAFGRRRGEKRRRTRHASERTLSSYRAEQAGE